uniref:Uncharacterized protein n=1 Tax=Cannabis sativa TaxID=3483 RepID=A0A803NNF2_CANSA
MLAHQTSSNVVVLSTEAKKDKDMLQYYLDQSLPKVSDQLIRADNELSLELVMGGVLKEAARMAYAYSRAKSIEAKNLATTNTLQREVDASKKEVQDVRNELIEVNKKLLAAKKRVEELTKEMQEMPSTAQLEADNDALSKEVNELKDERESLHTLLSKLEEDVQTRQTREEGLVKEVESLETAALEAAKENPEATTSTVPIDQNTEAPVAQNVGLWPP